VSLSGSNAIHGVLRIEQTAYLRSYSEEEMQNNATRSSYRYDSAGLAVLFFATVFSLNPFLNRLDTVLRYRILPVPVVFLRFAFWPHSYERSLALG